MTTQILEIVVFSHHQDSRSVRLNPGKVNVITGDSKTGKSALIDIVDYCFGAKTCNVPDGPIRNKVSWFGILLQLEEGQAFVARRCPSRKAMSSEDCFVEIGKSVKPPLASELRQNTNVSGLKSLLSDWTGIRDHLHTPPAGQTRVPLSASIRQSLPLCFQPQDEIIRRSQLFHGAGDGFAAQSIKDSIPYFLGAVEEDYIQKSEELRSLKTSLRACERSIMELEAVRGQGTSKASDLLAQARDVGLSSSSAESWNEVVSALTEVNTSRIVEIEPVNGVGEEYDRLSEERNSITEDLRRVRDELGAAVAFEKAEHGFTHEAEEQKARLVSIGIFEESTPGESCPLCLKKFTQGEDGPSVEQLQGVLSDVSSRLESVIRAAPRVDKAIAVLEKRVFEVREKLKENRSKMSAVLEGDLAVQQIRDDLSRKALILGRISLYIESLPDLPETAQLEEEAEVLRKKCEKLSEELSDSRIWERLSSIAAVLGQKFTSWATHLKLEFGSSPLRFDFKKLTIVADTPDGPIPMARMGSGENWVGYHLIGHLALHQWFVERKRPVPNFLFLDQPSQVYFPPELGVGGLVEEIEEENDRKAVIRMFKFIFSAVEDVAPGFQVILTEHADISEPWFQEVVVEKWRGGKKLIPAEWPQAE